MAYITGTLEVVTKDFSKEIKDMVMEKCFGLMEISIEDGGKTEFNMVKANYLLLTKE